MTAMENKTGDRGSACGDREVGIRVASNKDDVEARTTWKIKGVPPVRHADTVMHLLEERMSLQDVEIPGRLSGGVWIISANA